MKVRVIEKGGKFKIQSRQFCFWNDWTHYDPKVPSSAQVGIVTWFDTEKEADDAIQSFIDNPTVPEREVSRRSI